MSNKTLYKPVYTLQNSFEENLKINLTTQNLCTTKKIK